MVKMSNTQFKELLILLLMRVGDRRGISHLTAAHNWDCITDWRTDPDPTLLASTDKYPGGKYGAKS